MGGAARLLETAGFRELHARAEYRGMAARMISVSYGPEVRDGGISCTIALGFS
jgi:hypothetical protein